jgi:hypothetical protein
MLEEGDRDRPRKKMEIGKGQWPRALRADGKTLEF